MYPEAFYSRGVSRQCGPPELLDHNLNQFFPDLMRFNSTAEFAASQLAEAVRGDAERILNSVVIENLARSVPSEDEPIMRAIAWNLERGTMLDGIIAAFESHPGLQGRDALLLTELDYGMARSGNRFVAREIAQSLNLNYAFAPVYIALQKGSGVEAEVAGENTLSIHGLALFSRWPISNIAAVPLPNGKDKMAGKEKRLGYLRALIGEIDHPAGRFRAVTVHLDAHCSRRHRRRQMEFILDYLDTLPPLPTLIGGDWNTTTFNSQSSTRAILGYWRRVFMGPKNVARNHLPHPERFFERPLFSMLEQRGFAFREFNEIGKGTLHYHVASIEKNTNLRDWVPEWCFPFIFWAANRVGGSVSGRLDWFAGRGISVAPGKRPATIGSLTDEKGIALSDHDAITLDFVPAER